MAKVKISFRGSLAHQFYQAVVVGGEDQGVIITRLLKDAEGDIECRQEGKVMVYGRTSEKGRFPPDW